MENADKSCMQDVAKGKMHQEKQVLKEVQDLLAAEALRGDSNGIALFAVWEGRD